MRGRAGAALALVLLLGACAADDGGGLGSEDTAPASTTTTPPTPEATRLSRRLLHAGDLEARGYELLVAARPFTAQRSSRILLCEEDIRTELDIIAGRQSRFSDETVEVSHTVTSGGDTAAFLDRFVRVVEECPGSWVEPALPTGGGPVQREILGTYPLPEVEVAGAGAIVRSRNQMGRTQTIVVVLVRGAVVSSLSISGPVGSDFGVADPAVLAAARRLSAGQSPAGP